MPRQDDEFIVMPGKESVGALQRAIDMAAFPARAFKASSAQVTLQNMKMLNLAIMHFVQDYNENTTI